jgi:TolA-binding protein
MYENVTGYFNTYYNTKKLFDNAVAEIEKTPQKDRDTNYFAMYSVPKSAQDKFEKVIEKSNKVIQLYPRSAWVENSILMMGKAYIYRGETEAGLRKFKELLDNFPDSDQRFETMLWQVRALYQSKKEDEALISIKDIMTEASNAGEKDIELELILIEAQIYYQRENYDTAAERYHKAVSFSGSNELMQYAYSQLGKCHGHQGEYLKAADAYNKVGNFKPEFSIEFQSRLKQGMMLSQAGEHDAALDVYDALWEEKLKPEERGMVELETANNYLAMDDSSKAFPIYRLIDTTYKRTDASAKGYYQRGLWYEKKMLNLKTAKPYYEKAKTEFPSSEITLIAQRKSAYLTNYSKEYDNLAKYDSLLNDARQADTLKSDSDSLAKEISKSGIKKDSSSGSNDSTGTLIVQGNITKDTSISASDTTAGKITQFKNENKLGNSLPGDGTHKILESNEKSYTVGTWAKDRECLWNIAKKDEVYGNGWMWPKIYQRNRDKIKNPDLIKPKWILKIPGSVQTSIGENAPSIIDNSDDASIPQLMVQTKEDSMRLNAERKSIQASDVITPVEVSKDSLQKSDIAVRVENDTTNSESGSMKDTTIVKADSLPAPQLKSLSDTSHQVAVNRTFIDSVKAVQQHRIDTKALDAKEKNVIGKAVADTSKNLVKKISLTGKVQLKPDSVRAMIARTKFELAGLLYLEMDLPDSALFWYQSLIDSFPSSPLLPRAYYAMAEIHRSRNDSSVVDSLYNIIMKRYDKSEYAHQVKKILQMEVMQTDLDSAESIYKEGEELLQKGTIDKAVERFTEIAKIHRASIYAPKALYTIGWIMETILINNDSAAAVYKKLIKEYPSSLYAQDAKPRVSVKDDPKSIDQYIKINEIPALVKVDTGKQDKKDVSKPVDKIQPGDDQPINLDEEIDPGSDEENQDEEEEEPPPDEDDDGGGRN